MAKFEIKAWHAMTNEEKVFYYDSSLSTITDETGASVVPDALVRPPVSTPAKIEVGKKNLKSVKIQLGLSCNFECEYCSQRFVPHADSTNPSDVQPFVDNMDKWFEGGEDGKGLGAHFEFWGGEPFVYWKTLKPLAKAIIEKYPNATRSIITNGSLLDDEKIQWIIDTDMHIGISHDGPGQPVRGPDPLEDASSRAAILQLFKIRAPEEKVSFNAMVNSKNISRENIENYFKQLISSELGEEYLQWLVIGEGGFVDAYDEGGLANSLLDGEEDMKYRNNAFVEIRAGKVSRYISISQKMQGFLDSFKRGTRIESLPQKCGMDKSDAIAVDLNGNVLTCQNVSSVSNNPAGISHHIGNVSDLENVKVSTATHWSDREECPNCPVIHICKGACMFLSGELWEASCNNAFSDNIIIFANAFETLTGYIPVYINGPQREDRKDIFWWVNGKPEKVRKPKKVIPIFAA